MKISRLIIKNFQQFKDLDLNLVDPETGLPLEKVCLIGPNGTGKSTILRLLFARMLGLGKHVQERTADESIIMLRLHNGNKAVYSLRGATEASIPSSGGVVLGGGGFGGGGFGGGFRGGSGGAGGADELRLWDDLEKTEHWADIMSAPSRSALPFEFIHNSAAHDATLSAWSSDDLLISVPADQPQLLTNDPPQTTLNAAMEVFKTFPYAHVISTATVEQFWGLLIYLIKKRDSDYQQYLQLPANRKRTIEAVEQEFEKSHPKILPVLGELWNRILSKAGLEFDVANAMIPIQLSDNLQAHVRVIATKNLVNYNHLSTGIRNFIFRLGHICSLYFGRKINRGFLFVDEPENSLYPDFLYDLIDQYLGITHNTQMFVATHNPIIAAQFRPEERVLLDFDSNANVIARRGVSPTGDDPNDVLEKDFRVRSLYGREGVEKWERFLELRQLIKEATKAEDKKKLMLEFLNIGNTYNFDALSPQE